MRLAETTQANFYDRKRRSGCSCECRCSATHQFANRATADDSSWTRQCDRRWKPTISCRNDDPGEQWTTDCESGRWWNAES